jgi:outer membrane protein TolC
LRLARERKQFGVGAVLEDLQAQEDLTQSQANYLEVIAEFDKAQYSLVKATGGLAEAR